MRANAPELNLEAAKPATADELHEPVSADPADAGPVFGAAETLAYLADMLSQLDGIALKVGDRRLQHYLRCALAAARGDDPQSAGVE